MEMTTLLINIWADSDNSDSWDIRWSTELDVEKVIDQLEKLIKRLKEVK